MFLAMMILCARFLEDPFCESSISDTLHVLRACWTGPSDNPNPESVALEAPKMIEFHRLAPDCPRIRSGTSFQS